MQYRARIPEGVRAGQIVPVRVSGILVSVRMPKGKVGDAFIFEVTPATWDAARSNPSPVVEGGVVPIQAEVVRRHRSILSRLSNMCSCGSLFRIETDKCGPLREFAMAMLLGLLIGLSILVGFVLGILRVTDPVEVRIASNKNNNSPFRSTATATGGGGNTAAGRQQIQRTVTLDMLLASATDLTPALNHQILVAGQQQFMMQQTQVTTINDANGNKLFQIHTKQRSGSN